MTSDQYIMSLHRYFIWMDRMRVHFDNVLKAGIDKYGSKERFDIESFLYLSYCWTAPLAKYYRYTAICNVLRLATKNDKK